MRVLITGMGGELGTRVANLLEADPSIEAVVGIDTDPPRRRLHRADFHRIDPRDRVRTAEVVRSFEPTALVHLGVYEPYARSSPRAAIERTANGTIGVMAAVADVGTVDRVVVRSGIEVYGRRRGAPRCPDEDVRPDPTSPFGQVLQHTERVATETGLGSGIPVTLLRFAQLAGPHFPSPLGRYLRMQAVPFHALGDPAFSVLDKHDAVAAVLAALRRPYAGPVNVVGPGAVTASQAARMGSRLPVPVAGPGWRTARLLAELVGSPVPDHVHELLVRGRCADGSRAAERLGVAPEHPTPRVIEMLYEWAEVEYLAVTGTAA